MPVDESFSNLGTNSEGSFTAEFCSFCFQNGFFTKPDQTLEEMIESSIENMTKDLGMAFDQARDLATSFIPTLGRWKNI